MSEPTPSVNFDELAGEIELSAEEVAEISLPEQLHQQVHEAVAGIIEHNKAIDKTRVTKQDGWEITAVPLDSDLMPARPEWGITSTAILKVRSHENDEAAARASRKYKDVNIVYRQGVEYDDGTSACDEELIMEFNGQPYVPVTSEGRTPRKLDSGWVDPSLALDIIVDLERVREQLRTENAIKAAELALISTALSPIDRAA
jgi:hypothetical protein